MWATREQGSTSMLPPHCHTCRGCAGSLRDLAPDSLAEGRGLLGYHLAPLTLCSLTGHTFPGHWRPGHLCASPRAASPCGFPAKFHFCCTLQDKNHKGYIFPSEILPALHFIRFMIFPYQGFTPPHPVLVPRRGPGPRGAHLIQQWPSQRNKHVI